METVSGKVISKHERGYGFIEPDNEEDPAIFFHFTDFDGDFESLELGQRVEYLPCQELGGKYKRPKAICVLPILEGAEVWTK